MKYALRFALALTLCIFTLSTIASAQDDEGHIYVVMTFKSVIPEGGTSEERDALLTELLEASTRNNDKILSQISLRHFWGNDSRDWVVITEYESMEDFVASGDIATELNKKKWPDEEERDAFFKRLFEYFPSHSDEIYRELPKFGK